MNINKLTPYLTEAVHNSKVVKPGGEEKTVAASGISSDKVQLSKDYKELAQAQKTMAGTEESRTAKVEQLRNQLKSGSYTVNPDAIAGKMLDEII